MTFLIKMKSKGRDTKKAMSVIDRAGTPSLSLKPLVNATAHSVWQNIPTCIPEVRKIPQDSEAELSFVERLDCSKCLYKSKACAKVSKLQGWRYYAAAT